MTLLLTLFALGACSYSPSETSSLGDVDATVPFGRGPGGEPAGPSASRGPNGEPLAGGDQPDAGGGATAADARAMPGPEAGAPASDARAAADAMLTPTGRVCDVLGQGCTDGLHQGTCYIDPESKAHACCYGCLTGEPYNPGTRCLGGTYDNNHCGTGGAACRTCPSGTACLPTAVGACK